MLWTQQHADIKFELPDQPHLTPDQRVEYYKQAARVRGGPDFALTIILSKQVEELNKRKKEKAEADKRYQEGLKENREKDKLMERYKAQKEAEEDAYRREMEADERAEKASMPEQIRIEEKETLRKQERKEKQQEIDANSDL